MVLTLIKGEGMSLLKKVINANICVILEESVIGSSSSNDNLVASKEFTTKPEAFMILI